MLKNGYVEVFQRVHRLRDNESRLYIKFQRRIFLGGGGGGKCIVVLYLHIISPIPTLKIIDLIYAVP